MTVCGGSEVYNTPSNLDKTEMGGVVASSYFPERPRRTSTCSISIRNLPVNATFEIDILFSNGILYEQNELHFLTGPASGGNLRPEPEYYALVEEGKEIAILFKPETDQERTVSFIISYRYKGNTHVVIWNLNPLIIKFLVTFSKIFYSKAFVDPYEV